MSSRLPRTHLRARLLKPVGVISLILASAHMAQAQYGQVDPSWVEFQNNPRAFMEKNPPKFDSHGNPLPQSSNSLFPTKDIRSRSFVDKKTRYRLGQNGDVSSPICTVDGICLDEVLSGRAQAQENVTDFIDLREFQAKGVKPTASLNEMENRKLMSAQLDETPWSDTYWPISQGILGVRYATQGVSNHNWKANYDFVIGNKTSLKAIFSQKDSFALETLSPSEKYDLLIGDLTTPGRVYENGYLTPSMWAAGEDFFKSSGSVETWMGICHGWAPAAFMLPRPSSALTVKAADGKTDLKFFPSDLKGLGSYLWAKAQVPTRYLGGRCNDKNPKTDRETGRILNEECFDTNPGNWHVAIVNQIGVAKRSFVMDATYDYEVWNQPVFSYKYQYFNPDTGLNEATLDAAMIEIDQFKNDKFKKFRSGKTKYVVGIRMDVTYIVETNASHNELDSSRNDAKQTVSYMYDLELDARKQIIGGEWYTNSHPDFLWIPEMNGRALSFGDSQINPDTGWTPGEPLPKFWRDIAITTAVRYGQPLAAIVEPLMHASHQQVQPQSGTQK